MLQNENSHSKVHIANWLISCVSKPDKRILKDMFRCVKCCHIKEVTAMFMAWMPEGVVLFSVALEI